MEDDARAQDAVGAITDDEGDTGFVIIGYVEHDKIVSDPFNANEGTALGTSMLESSLEQFGAGRSVLLDRNNHIIAGNKTMEKWVEMGGKVAIVESDGNTLFAVRRRDLDLLRDPRARAAAFADNRVGEANLSWVLGRIVEASASAAADYIAPFWSEAEIKDITAQVNVPSLDDLENQYGKPTPKDFYAHLYVAMPQPLLDRYNAMIKDMEGEPHERFERILDAAQTHTQECTEA